MRGCGNGECEVEGGELKGGEIENESVEGGESKESLVRSKL